MATAPTDFNGVLSNIGFNAECRTVLTDATKENLDLDTVATWNNEEVDDLVRTLRKTIVGYVAPTANTRGVPGHALYVRVGAIENLKTVAFVGRHCIRTGRTPTHAMFTPTFIKDWTGLRKEEANYEDPDDFPKLLKADDATIIAFCEDFPEQLARFTGIGGRPLSYIIRDFSEVPDVATDPMFGETDSLYNSIRDEVANRAAHTGVIYKADNKRVFEILYDAISEFEEVKVWIKGNIRNKDGRSAWFAFTSHYLGSSQLDNIAERADLRIESCVYHGEKTRYTFETHVSNFKKAHLDLAKAGNEPDGRTKVRKFLQSIKAPELQTAVGVAKSQDKYLTDFEETINYLRRFVLPLSTGSRTVASIGTGDRGAPGQPPGLTYRWYKKDEFAALPEEHKTWLRAEKKRRDQEAKKAKKDKKSIKSALKKEKRKLAKLKTEVKKARQEPNAEEAKEPNP